MVRGTWRFIGRNRIRATSPEDRSAPAVAERVVGQGDEFIVLVLSPEGAIVAGAEISGIANGSAFRIRTTNEGYTRIPRCQQFEIAFNGYRGIHTVVNAQANDFTITLMADQISRTAIDEIWLIEGNRLYVAQPDGSFDRDYWLRRLSRREERRIFH